MRNLDVQNRTITLGRLVDDACQLEAARLDFVASAAAAMLEAESKQRRAALVVIKRRST